MTDIVYNKNGVPFDIDAIATDLNGKMDKDGVNAECPTLLSRTANNVGGVTEIWSDGYCVQTGITPSGTSGTINLDQAYKDDTYKIFANVKNCANDNVVLTLQPRVISTNSFTYVKAYNQGSQEGPASEVFYWETKGYIR